MEKCWLPAFSLFPTIVFIVYRTNFTFSVTIILSSANALKLVWSKVLLFGKELKELKESMDRCIGHGDITEILL